MGFLFAKGFEMRKVDQTSFLLRQGVDILIVQMYVDDIIFGGSLSHPILQRNRMHLTCAPGSFYTHMIDKTRVIPLQ
jgi:hypothetical protein